MNKNFRAKPVGWRNDSYRHYLAAKGIKTKKFSKQQPKKLAQVRNTIITAEPHREDRMYPIAPNDVKEVLKNLPEDDVKGLKEVSFVDPKGMQENAWGQFIRSKRKILIFSQPADEKSIDQQNPDKVYAKVKNYVLPHEVGHHVALERRKITDEDIAVAEGRADAYAAGYDVESPVVKQFANNYRKTMSGQQQNI